MIITKTTYGGELTYYLTGVAVISGLVYAVGGFNGSLRVRTVDVYDPIKDIWTSIASMEARRSTLGAAVLNGLIYAVGGFDGSSGTVIIYAHIKYSVMYESDFLVHFSSVTWSCVATDNLCCVDNNTWS